MRSHVTCSSFLSSFGFYFLNYENGLCSPAPLPDHCPHSVGPERGPLPQQTSNPSALSLGHLCPVLCLALSWGP